MKKSSKQDNVAGGSNKPAVVNNVNGELGKLVKPSTVFTLDELQILLSANWGPAWNEDGSVFCKLSVQYPKAHIEAGIQDSSDTLELPKEERDVKNHLLEKLKGVNDAEALNILKAIDGFYWNCETAEAGEYFAISGQ